MEAQRTKSRWFLAVLTVLLAVAVAPVGAQETIQVPFFSGEDWLFDGRMTLDDSWSQARRVALTPAFDPTESAVAWAYLLCTGDSLLIAMQNNGDTPMGILFEVGFGTPSGPIFSEALEIAPYGDVLKRWNELGGTSKASRNGESIEAEFIIPRENLPVRPDGVTEVRFLAFNYFDVYKTSESPNLEDDIENYWPYLNAGNDLILPTGPVGQPNIEVDPPAFDLVYEEGTPHEEVLTITNTGTEALVIESIHVRSFLSLVWLDRTPLPPGASREVRLKFRTGYCVGGYHTLVQIESNDPDRPLVEVPVTLTVIGKPIILLPREGAPRINVLGTPGANVEIHYVDLLGSSLRMIGEVTLDANGSGSIPLSDALRDGDYLQARDTTNGYDSLIERVIGFPVAGAAETGVTALVKVVDAETGEADTKVLSGNSTISWGNPFEKNTPEPIIEELVPSVVAGRDDLLTMLPGFGDGNVGQWRVHTEIPNMNIESNDGFKLMAGQDALSTLIGVPDIFPCVVGVAESQDTTGAGAPETDFPANIFFRGVAVVGTPQSLLFTKTGIILDPEINELPPVAYFQIVSPTGSAIPLHSVEDPDGPPVAYLTSGVIGMGAEELIGLPMNDPGFEEAAIQALAEQLSEELPLPPVADAGDDQIVVSGNAVSLDGGASVDPGGNPLAYSWDLISAPAGSVAEIVDPTAVQTSFVADLAGTYVVSLTVHNGIAESYPDTTTITVVTPGQRFIPSDTEIGTWDPVNRVYTLTTDVYDAILIEEDDLTLDGAGHSVFGFGEGCGIQLENRRRVTVTNLHVQGFSNGVCLHDSGDNTLTGITASNNDTGIFLQMSWNNTLHDCTAVGNAVGISLDYAERNTLRNCSMLSNTHNFSVRAYNANYLYENIDASNTVDGRPICYWVGRSNETIPPDAGFVALIECDHITVENLTLTGNGQGVVLGHTSDCTIRNIDVSHCQTGIFASVSSSNIISNSTFTNNSEGLYIVNNSNTNTVCDNTLNNNELGMYLQYCQDPSIIQNEVSGSSWHGMMVGAGCTGATVTENMLSGCGWSISMAACNNSIIADNTVADGLHWGFTIWDSTAITVEDNICSNTPHGIDLQGNNSSITLTGNTVHASAESGICLSDSTGIVLTGNTVSETRRAIRIYDTTACQVYNNVFLDNYSQAEVYGASSVVFNLPAPAGGNHWSNWTVPDADGDGFVDSPYVFNGGQDNLPWAQPDGWLVRTPEELVHDLIDVVISLNLHQGIDNSLDAKLDAALKALEDVNENNDVAAVNTLQAFINAVEAQRGNHIPEADADAMITAAQQIIAVLGL